MKAWILYFLATGIGFQLVAQPAADINGEWRGVFRLQEKFDAPFEFSIDGKPGQQQVFFLNAEERFEGGRVEQRSDSIYFLLDQFDNEMAVRIHGDSLVGWLRRQDGSGKPIPVTATKGKQDRFIVQQAGTTGDISGTYEIEFASPTGKPEKAVGLFQQDGQRLRGTFLRITGDSRYLEGVVEGNQFRLSSFIGSGPSLYTGTFTNNGKIEGTITGARGNQHFSGQVNEEASLPDPYQLTYLKNGYKQFEFSFPDVDGNKISLSDKKYKDKVVIVTITGTWCPNCADETSFLAPWIKANRQRGVEAIAIHYERKTDSAFVRSALSRYRKKFNIDYDQVVGGVADKIQVAASLPSLNSFLSFPTMIIIDRKGNVAKIHTGYTGPATGKYYDDFVTEFNQQIDTLLK